MTTRESKKHPCPDCRACQGCSPTRCHLCRGQGSEDAERRFAGLSIAEQCALFDAVNRGEAPEGDYRPQGAVFPIINPW
ncbi:MAG: hypothetical protein KKC30_18180 [Proteobacteria bacterium]|nr:hypothetical protein [Pseudomonadota bacterium]MBU4381969.1 hypothetical protein [Pseudomonadota bacterium]MBU4605307.1 hypothetical protein [Pseudomonadota bacterium]MCG2765589.1 hypothetical protein [Desulfarculaceae bacterium]